MKRLLVLLLFLIPFLTGNPAHSTNYQEGMNAALERDYVTALKIWTPLAQKGYATPQFQLGWLYEKGYGVSQDYATAFKWYRRAAEQGYAYAQSALGRMLRDGHGVPKDVLRAYMWFSIAAALWDPDANKMKITISNTMAPADILNAQKLARECVEKNYKNC